MKDNKTSRKTIWLYRIAAVIAAVIIWLMVVNTDDPVTRKRIAMIPITFENTQVFTNNGMTYSVEDNIDSAVVYVYARRTVLDDITADDFSARVDFNMINDMNGAVPVQVSYNGSTPIDSFTVVTDTIRISSENVTSEVFDLNITTTGALPDGYWVGQIVPDPLQVTVTGPDSVVNSIYSVGAIVDVSGATETVSETVDLHYYNFRGQEMDLSEYADDLYISDDTGVITTADVDINILYETVVPLEFTVTGASRVANGYAYTGFDASGNNVVIRGPEEVVTALGVLNITSSELSVAGARADRTVTLDLSEFLPEGCVTAGDSEVEVVMHVEELVTNTYEIEFDRITLSGADTDLYSYAYDDEPLSVKLTGIAEAVDAVTAADITVTCDVSGLEEGTYRLPVEVTVPEGCTLSGEVYADVLITVNETESGSESGDADTESNGGTSSEDTSAES